MHRAGILIADKVRNGEIKGITDPEEAKKIIREGSITYEQAQNLAKSGTIESLKYDAENGIVSATSAMGVSATVVFAKSIWDHDDIETALRKSLISGLQVGGNSFVVSVLASQLSRAGLNSLLIPGSKAFTSLIGPKASAVIANASRIGVTPIYGAAAMQSAAHILRGNIITGSIAVIVLAVPDIVKTFNGKISPKQLAKNTAVSATGMGVGMVGAGAGATAGAELGTLIMPGPGTVVGGIVGGIAGGIAGAVAGSAGADAIADRIAPDDTEEMLDIMSAEFQKLGEEYLLSQEEADQITNMLSMELALETLEDMHASKSPETYARNLLMGMSEEVVSGRETIVLPDEETIAEELVETLEAIYDTEAMGEETEPEE